MTGDDLVEAKLGVMGVPFQRKRPDGSPMFARAFLGLAQGTVRYVGEPVAFVVAETLAQAKDAAELIDIDYGRCLRSPTPPRRRRARLPCGTQPITDVHSARRPYSGS